MAGTTTPTTGSRENKPKGGREKRERRDGDFQKEKSPYTERVVFINRVAKVVKGGRRFSFTALVVVGDGKGMVGVGYGKAKEVPQAIAKAVEDGKKNFFKVPILNGTIPHPVQGEKSAGVILLRPASPGTGVIAQEIETVLPRVVTENDEGIKHVQYGNIVGTLIEAIKEQQRQIEVLQELAHPPVAPGGASELLALISDIESRLDLLEE